MNIITARVCGKVMFSYCLCVCLSVCAGYNFRMPYHRNYIAVCTYRLVMINIERFETAQRVHFKSETNSVQDKIQSETKLSLRIFFSDGQKKDFFGLNFVSDWILSQTQFCLRLNLSWITYHSCISCAIFYFFVW